MTFGTSLCQRISYRLDGRSVFGNRSIPYPHRPEWTPGAAGSYCAKCGHLFETHDRPVRHQLGRVR